MTRKLYSHTEASKEVVFTYFSLGFLRSENQLNSRDTTMGRNRREKRRRHFKKHSKNWNLLNTQFNPLSQLKRIIKWQKSFHPAQPMINFRYHSHAHFVWCLRNFLSTSNARVLIALGERGENEEFFVSRKISCGFKSIFYFLFFHGFFGEKKGGRKDLTL